jgi:hypothetical protein
LRTQVELRNGKIWFSEEIKKEHRRLKTSLFRYAVYSRVLAILTAPFIYACILPFVLLDLFVSMYQWVCFPVYGVPKARLRDYMAIDRNKLRYLNALEGLIVCTAHMQTDCLPTLWKSQDGAALVPNRARARRIQQAHDRYSHFLPFGDAAAYRERIDKVRNDFK